MNEQAFTYEHFDNASYLFAAIGLMQLGLVIAPVMQMPFLVVLLLCSALYIYSMVRMFKFLRKHKTLRSKEQGKIIRRHRYSLRWGFPILALCLSLTFLFARLFEVNYLQVVAFFGMCFMFISLIGVRIYLRGLKQRMTLTT